jgi:hypothetical protein
LAEAAGRMSVPVVLNELQIPFPCITSRKNCKFPFAIKSLKKKMSTVTSKASGLFLHLNSWEG